MEYPISNDHDIRFRELLEKVKQYNPTSNLDLLNHAFERCRIAHANQMRQSGEPYIVHPLEVAHILADMELDSIAIAAGLLHDVIEDTEFEYNDIRDEFGDDVAEIVEGLTKLDKIKYSTQEEQQIENVRKMLLAMAKDVRVILIKLADRLHNMRTLKYLPQEKQLIKARETLEVYAPLAHRLGISKIKWELEDLSLRYLDSVAYYEIVEGINQKKEEREKYISEIIEELRAKLDELGIKSKVFGRAKHFYSIFRKMYKQNKTIDEIYDLFAVRIIVDSVSDCYAALGMVHELYKPMPGRFKDYIAMPKPNMYQSLHTTVIGKEGKPFEIQIRTWEMHQVAENGVAAHWKYKEGASAPQDMDSRLQWVRQLLEIQRDLTDADDFMHTLKIDLFSDQVFVFTPKGDVVSLPAGATPIDFAFYIHSAVGYRMIGAKVNSKIVPLEYQLNNGDIIEILTSSSVHGPSQDWLNIVKTSQAKNKINQWFKKENREENILKGKDLILGEIKHLGIKPELLLKQEYVDSMLKRYNFKTLDDMYAAVGYGGIPVNKVITRLKDAYQEEHKEEKTEAPETVLPTQERKESHKSSEGIIVKGIENCLVRLSRCCTPVPGDEIVGFITRGRGVSVHRKDCTNVENILHSKEDEKRLIECEWANTAQNGYISELTIEGNDRNGLLSEVVAVFTEMKLPVHALNARTLKTGELALFDVSVEIADIKQLHSLVKRLRHIPGVLEVNRSRN